MDRTPPRNINTRSRRNGRNDPAQGQSSDQLHPDVGGEDSSNSTTPQPPNTPSPGNTSEVLMLILERLDNIEKEPRDSKKDMDAKIQDLNALMIQSNSPRRGDRPNSPTPRSQTPVQGT